MKIEEKLNRFARLEKIHLEVIRAFEINEGCFAYRLVFDDKGKRFDLFFYENEEPLNIAGGLKEYLTKLFNL